MTLRVLLSPTEHDVALLIALSDAQQQPTALPVDPHHPRAGGLKHDDRLDSVAGRVAALQRSLGVDAEVHREALLKAQRDAVMERFVRVHEEGGMLAGRGCWNPDVEEFDKVVRTRVG